MNQHRCSGPTGDASEYTSVHTSVNGEPWHGRAGTTVSDLVAAWCPSPKGVAVACNGDVVPKSRWATTEVASGDRIEIVTAAAGG